MLINWYNSTIDYVKTVFLFYSTVLVGLSPVWFRCLQYHTTALSTRLLTAWCWRGQRLSNTVRTAADIWRRLRQRKKTHYLLRLPRNNIAVEAGMKCFFFNSLKLQIQLRGTRISIRLCPHIAFIISPQDMLTEASYTFVRNSCCLCLISALQTLFVLLYGSV